MPAAPWGKPSGNNGGGVSVSVGAPGKKGGLLDIMSEQLAEHLDVEYNTVKQPALQQPPAVNGIALESDPSSSGVVVVDDDLVLLSSSLIEEEWSSRCGDGGGGADTAAAAMSDLDFALAAQLQEEEDALRWQQDRHGPKGNVTVQHFHPVYKESEELRLLKLQQLEQDADEEDDDGISKPTKKSPPWKIRDKSLKGQGGDKDIITKHDLEVNGHKNARKLEKTVPNCGSLGDTLVPNRIYNSLQHKMKKQAHAEKGVLGRTVEEDSTRSKGLDAKTRLVIHRLLDAGVLDAVNYVVRSGKEGVIFHAVGPTSYDKGRPGKAPYPARTLADDEEDEDAQSYEDEVEEEFECEDMGAPGSGSGEFAIKVYKTNLTEFANRHEYVEGDHRFASVGQLSRQNKQKIVKIWAEKELKNMTRMHRAGIPCPEPVRLDRNVLIMSFIGEDGWGAPQLADLDLGSSQSKAAKCFVQVLLLARALWDRCKLVHSDLSEFNVLLLNGKCFVVDVGQAVERQHPNALQFLRRDVFNVLTFFFNKCKKTGCGGNDDSVEKVMDWIMNGATNLEENIDENEWCIYAKEELGTWADYRLACQFGELLLV
jgi:serine/threonine-protein kinase RIO1